MTIWVAIVTVLMLATVFLLQVLNQELLLELIKRATAAGIFFRINNNKSLFGERLQNDWLFAVESDQLPHPT